MIRVLLADSHQLLHLGIRTALSTNNKFTLIDAVTCETQLRQLCRQHQPDVILLALNITASSGTEVINDIRQQCPATKILVLLHNPDEICLQQLMETGVTGCILKSDTPEKLIEAIQAVTAGHSWFSPQLMSELIRSQNNAKNSNKLTRRETEVLQLIASGKTDKEIARDLEITERTVRYHLQNINDELGTITRTEAVAEAIRRQIIQ